MVDPLQKILMAKAAAESVGQRIAGALAAQRDLYLQLGQLARQQSEYVATGESELLMTVLAARSRLIEQIVPLDEKLTPYKGRWQEVLDGMPAEDRERVVPLLKEVQGLLADILAHDEADKESLVRQKQQVGSEIGRAVTGTVVNKAYGVKPRMGGGLGKA
jgi:hypothetical protein